MIIFGAALVVLYLVFWAWHSPWAGKLTKAEIDRYLAIIERSLQPAEEVEAFTSRVRSWAEADDGRPVYMVNLMHFLLQFRTFPGAPQGNTMGSQRLLRKRHQMAMAPACGLPDFQRDPSGQEPDQHPAGENMGRDGRRPVSQSSHLSETIVRTFLRGNGTL